MLPRRNQTFETYYQVSYFLEGLESAISIFTPYFHKLMVNQGMSNGAIDEITEN